MRNCIGINGCSPRRTIARIHELKELGYNCNWEPLQLDLLTMAESNGHHQPLECIDLASPNKITLAARVREACMNEGFFYIINHGIDSKFLAEVFAQSKKFFMLPLEEKMKVFRDKNQRGYIPFEYEMLNPDFQTRGETKESFYVGSTIPGSDVPFYGPNQFPSSGLEVVIILARVLKWVVEMRADVELLPGWKEIMERYYQELVYLCKRLASLIALALNLDESFFYQKGIIDQSTSIMRLLHYSVEESNIEEGVFGAGPHSDWGFLTLLITDDVPGLQICRKEDAMPQVWEDVPPMNGAFIVNLGQMLERWSNGIFRATLHRVIGKGVERYSIPFFFQLNYDCVVDCFPTCCSEDNPPKYPPITSGDYLTSRYKATHKNAFV